MKQILINCESLENRIAVVENGKLQDYLIERTDRDTLVGSIYKGKIRNLESSLQAAFVDIGAEKNAFLHYWDMIPATEEALMQEQEEAEHPSAQRQQPPQKQQDRPAKEQARGWFSRIQERFLGSGKEDSGGKQSSQRKQQPQQRRRRKPRKRPTVNVEDIPDLFKVNGDILVQVTKGPIGTKGARVTTNLSIPGRYLVLLPNSSHVGVSKKIADREERDRIRQILRRLNVPKGMGLICRTAAAGKKERFFQQDFQMLLSNWKKLQHAANTRKSPCCVYEEPSLIERSLRDFLTEDVDEIVIDSRENRGHIQEIVRNFSKDERVKVRYHTSSQPLFHKYNLTPQIESIFLRKVELPSGGYICVDETEALIAIDVNSGRNRAGKDHPETIMNTNLEAVDEIARQLRLRNIGGLVVLDLIDMRARKDRHTVYKALRTAAQRDRARTKILPISDLGLVEMTRQREQGSLSERLFSPCPYCSGKGLVKSPTSISVEIQRRIREVLHRKRRTVTLRITVHPDVLERLRDEDAKLIRDLEKEYGGELSFRTDASLHMEEYRLEELKKS